MFQLNGMSQLLRQIEQMERILNGDVKEKALIEGAKILQENAKEIVRQTTGKLRNNIIISDVKNEEIHVGPDQQGTAFYGHFLEYGTSKMEPIPFLGPAFENNKDAVQEKMAETIKRELGL